MVKTVLVSFKKAKEIYKILKIDEKHQILSFLKIRNLLILLVLCKAQ